MIKLMATVIGGAVIAFGAVGCGSTQPHMRDALDHLRAAREQLEAATADKGGHRIAAIAFTDSAIREVRAGMEFAAETR